MLGVSLRTIQIWVDNGILQAWKTAGGHRRVSVESVLSLKEGDESRSAQEDQRQSEVLLAYQPIVDEVGHTLGFELLYREGQEHLHGISDPVLATSRVIARTFGQLGLLGAMGSGICFINIDEQMLHEDVLLTLLPDRVVLELSMPEKINESLVDRCRFLKGLVYRPER